MNVEVSGSATVAIKVISDRPDQEIFDVPGSLYDMLKGLESRVFPGLEPFVRGD